MAAVDVARAKWVAENMEEGAKIGMAIGDFMQSAFNAGYHAGLQEGAKTKILGQQMTLPFHERDEE